MTILIPRAWRAIREPFWSRCHSELGIPNSIKLQTESVLAIFRACCEFRLSRISILYQAIQIVPFFDFAFGGELVEPSVHSVTDVFVGAAIVEFARHNIGVNTP